MVPHVVYAQRSRAFSPKNPNVDNPLDGNVLTVKVPFRYRRVMCSIRGCPHPIT